MDRKTKKLILLISAVLIIISSIPYLYGWAIAPANTVYLGNGLFNPHDSHVYYAYIEQVKSGRWLFNDVFTSEAHKPFLNIFWLVIGLMAKFFSLSPILAFHLARIILIPIFVFTIFKFLDRAWLNDAQKQFKTHLALAIFFFTSGIGGWMALLATKNTMYPAEVWWPEGYAFFSIYASPHFIASWILMVGSLYFYLLGIQTKNYKKIIWGGFLGAILVQFHTFYLALLIPLTLIFLLVKYKKNHPFIFWYTALYNIFFIPVILYYFLLVKTDQIMSKRLMENIMHTPQPEIFLFFVFGFLFFLALPSLLLFFKRKEENLFHNFLMVWLLAVPFLLYSGLTFERRLVEGWQLPTVFFAVETLYLIYQRIHYKKDFIIILLVLLFANNFFIFIAEFTVYHGTTENRQYYLPKNLYQSYLWLKKEDPDYNKIILSSPLTSLTATFLADKTVFQGHGFETINAELKKNIWLTFINSNADDEKKIEFLKNWKIDYFFWGPYEKIQKPQYRPEEKNYLKQIYQADGVIIYKINNP